MKNNVLQIIDNYLSNLDNIGKKDFLMFDLIRRYDEKGLFYLKIKPIFYNFFYDLEVIDNYLILDLNLDNICITLNVFKLNKTSIKDVLIIFKELVKFYP